MSRQQLPTGKQGVKRSDTAALFLIGEARKPCGQNIPQRRRFLIAQQRHFRQIAFIATDERRAQHGRRLQIASGIIEPTQKRKHGLHFGRRKITAGLLRVHGNPRRTQHFDKNINPRRDRTHQNYRVAPAERTKRAVVFLHDGRLVQMQQLIRDRLRLRFHRR